MSYIGNTPFTAAFLTDTFSGNGSTVAFTMSVAPANTSSILVAVTGVVQDPSTYSVSGTTLTFSQAPPSGTSNISVRYLGIPASGVTTTAYRTQTEFTATAGQTTFTVPSYTVGFIDVYRNGLLLGSADFTATTGTTVVLANACTAGDFVETVSFYVSSVLNAIPATASSVSTAYLQDASVTQAKLGAGVAGTGPAFSAYLGGSISVSNSTLTKYTATIERFDTNSCFDTSLSRFTPNVAGYYYFALANWFTSGTGNNAGVLQKNGSTVFQEYDYMSGGLTTRVSGVIYMNGTTDYVEAYVYQFTGSTLTLDNNAINPGFSGYMVRAA